MVPAEIPLPATDTDTNCSDLDIPLIETLPASVPPSQTIIESPPKPEIPEAPEFAVPKEPSPKGSTRDRGKSQPRSRSETSRGPHPQGVNPSDPSTNVKRVRGIGRGKIRETANTVPAANSNLLAGVALPRDNLRITIPSGDGRRKVEVVPDYPANVAHLAGLEDDSKKREDAQLSSAIKPDFVAQLSCDNLQEDSEIDITTGEIKDSATRGEPRQFSFQPFSVLEDHQQFAQEVLKLEPDLWDSSKVESNPSLFYHAYFLDQQKISEVRQKGTVRIQQFNVKVTRQSADKDIGPSSRFNRERLEAKFKVAIGNIYQAFEDAYQFESPEFIEDLRSHLLNTAVTQITSLFTSSRCRACHRDGRMDATWRLRRFETLLPYLSEVPLESFRRAEDHRANVLLDKTSLIADGPSMDKFRLGFTIEERRTCSSLTPSEKKSFDEELAALANNNSLMRLSRRWENCKFVSPALDINLGHQAFQKMRQLRRQNLLPVAQMLLSRYHDRQEQLIERFGKSQVHN